MRNKECWPSTSRLENTLETREAYQSLVFRLLLDSSFKGSIERRLSLNVRDSHGIVPSYGVAKHNSRRSSGRIGASGTRPNVDNSIANNIDARQHFRVLAGTVVDLRGLSMAAHQLQPNCVTF